jgi:two-component system response regulator AtoC
LGVPWFRLAAGVHQIEEFAQFSRFDPQHRPATSERSIHMSTSDHNFPASRKEDAVFPSGEPDGVQPFLPGSCPAMRSVEQVMRELATGDAPVLIRAEAGAGKRTAAERIHQMSIRRSQPFVALDCATLTAGSLESSVSNSFSRGTVLLEEVASLTPACQAKLMDFLETGSSLQNGTGNARLVFTTARDLEGELAARRFREDLYYRISGVCLRLPPLRQRREEIPQLVGFYLARYSAELGRRLPKLSAEAGRRLQDYAWPGNLRELQDVAKAIVVLGDEALVLGGLRGLSVLSGGRSATRVSLKEASKAASREAEKELILKALNKTRWNRRRAAQELQISYKALLYKLKQIGCEEYGA